MARYSKSIISLIVLIIAYIALFIDLIFFELKLNDGLNPNTNEFDIRSSIFYYTSNAHCQAFRVRFYGQLILMLGPLLGGFLISKIMVEYSLLKSFQPTVLSKEKKDENQIELQYPKYTRSNRITPQNRNLFIILIIVLVVLILYNPIYYVYYDYKIYAARNLNTTGFAPNIPILISLWANPFLIYMGFMVRSEFSNNINLHNLMPILIGIVTFLNLINIFQLLNVLLCG